MATSNGRAGAGDRLRGAVNELGALAQRGRWSDACRAGMIELVGVTAAGTTGPREIFQRYRALARALGRTDRARTWQVIRRVASPGVRAFLDAVYRNER